MPPARFRGRFLKNTEKQRRETCSKVLKKYHQDRASLAENLNNVSSQDSAVASGNLPKWREGRRIVELGLLADGLRSCVDCGQPLDLCRTVDETQSGYGSILYVECQCGVLNSITTNKTQFTSPSLRGRPAFDVNTKAALGKYFFLQIISVDLGLKEYTHTSVKGSLITKALTCMKNYLYKQKCQFCKGD